MDNIRNMQECYYIQELVHFFGDELVYMYQLHGRCTILSLSLQVFRLLITCAGRWT
jgi:hypothetical protein